MRRFAVVGYVIGAAPISGNQRLLDVDRKRLLPMVVPSSRPAP
jgi:hypothetical protein